ncbi:MAG: glycyl-radical enzyme activating protein [Dehalococcoidia bacterium]|nr:glycyl-radical enzyme activating protein [Dehalococcoidia bacterium]
MTPKSVKTKDSEAGALDIKGRVFDIQRFSIQDGPGIRTTVFFKGCPLSCLWCCNPESQNPAPQLIFMSHLCQRCHKCVAVCPNHAVLVSSDGSVEIDRGLCQACGKCVDVCIPEARRVSGKVMTVGEVVEIVRKDAPFYRNSGGGVTASGGEATAQSTFLLNLLRECHNRGYHTALETCGYLKWTVLEPILAYVDLVLFDLKHTDSETHKKLTGVSNELILENARKIVAKGVPLILRIPLIPGCNDSEQNMRNTAQFALELGGVEVNLLPYHKLGMKKYEALDMEYRMSDVETMKEDAVKACVEIVHSYGVDVKVV